MRRTLKTLSPCLVAFLLMLTVAFAGNAQELQKKLEGLKGISGIEKLESDHYAEKYLVRITQPVDHKNPAAGTFTQRVIVAHVGFDRPTILVTEGYGAAYALNPRYQEELRSMGSSQNRILITCENSISTFNRYILTSYQFLVIIK